MTHVVVVGAGAAGLTAGDALRRSGHQGRLTIVGSEVHSPYDRPPLSKQVLGGDWDADRVQLRKEGHFDAQDIDLRLGEAVAALEPAVRRLKLESGNCLDYDKLIIATGVAPRELPFGHHLPEVFTLKSIDDALALRAALALASRVLVVGAGFLGTEVAATAAKLGAEVVVVDPLEAPLVRGLGAWMGGLVADVHAEHGVRIRTGVGVSGFEEHGGRLRSVAFDDETSYDADLVIVAIGSVPATGWLAGSGVAVDDGVTCDEYCLVSDDIAAAGDVARFRHLGYGRTLRLEHRMNATEQSQAAAANLVAAAADRVPFQPVPYFWTDQYDLKIQAYGITPPDATVQVVSGDVASRKFVATYESGGEVVGVVGWNSPRELREHRAALGSWS